jgi:RNA polymerase sigma-70 factor (ECF subfamily)
MQDGPARHDKLATFALRRSKLSAEEAVRLREVFSDIAYGHHDEIWERLRRRGLEAHEADDLFQEAFIELYEYILEHGFPDNIGGMLHTLARNKLLNYLRVRQRIPFSLGLPSSGSEKPGSTPDLDLILDLRAVWERITPQLAPELRAVVDAVIVGGLSHQEAAELLEIPVGTVKSRVVQAKEELLALAEPLLPPSQRGGG